VLTMKALVVVVSSILLLAVGQTADALIKEVVALSGLCRIDGPQLRSARGRLLPHRGRPRVCALTLVRRAW
jgi:hypothetical protein